MLMAPACHDTDWFDGRAQDECMSVEDELRARVATAEERIAAHRETIEGIVASVRSENVDDEHDPEGATLGWERQQAAALLADAEADRAAALAALERVAAGTYGVCEVCGREIPAARLEARPAATRCVEHA
jgi:DnaK suppressor protein